MRKSEKLKKIQLLLNQKNLYEDQYERCGYLFQQGLSEEQLTGYIEQEQEKEMSSEQIDRAFEKTDNIAADEIDSFDGDINDFLQE